MALNSLICADVLLSNYSHSLLTPSHAEANKVFYGKVINVTHSIRRHERVCTCRQCHWNTLEWTEFSYSEFPLCLKLLFDNEERSFR